ncbi:MAG: hypothetical protein GY725_18430 [bacterium]|nr:hypothetical protein [bacterium]
MRRVLITHVDSAVGRRLVKVLYHDPDVSLVLGMGTGPEPSFFEAYRDKCAYQRLDLAKARHLNNFFHSERFARARLDSVLHLPFTSNPPGEHIPGNVSVLVSETRRLVEECQKQSCIERFVYLSTAFVYRPEPGNASVFDEGQLLGYDAEEDPEVRSWIDADMICQREANDPKLSMTILRAASIVTENGDFVNSPPLQRGSTPLGFDPIFSVVTERDVARALVLALHSDRPGAYNISGREVFPRSELCSNERRFGLLTVPGFVNGAVSLIETALGRNSSHSTVFHRFGAVLNTRLAAESLGFEPQYRVEVRGRGGERRVETVRCR